MWCLNRGASVDRHNALSTTPLPPYISKGPALSLQDPQGHTHSPWFKSTLLLFLRLLLSTKKKMACQTFFFLLLPQKKTGHREWYITDLQTRRELSDALQMGGSVKQLTAPLQRQRLCPFPVKGLVSCSLSARGPSGVLPIPDRSVHQGPGCQRHRPLPKRCPRSLTENWLRSHSSQSPRQRVVFLWQCSVACSNNKLVAIKADAVFS